MTTPRISYNIKSKLWECAKEGKLNSLGEGSTPKEAYDFHRFYYGYLIADKVSREFLINTFGEDFGYTN